MIHIKTKHLQLLANKLQGPLNKVRVTNTTVTLASYYPAIGIDDSITLSKRKYLRLIRKATKWKIKNTE